MKPSPLPSTIPFGLRALSVAALLASSPALAAGSDPAEDLFNKGMERFNAGDFAKACPAIEQSYKLDPRPGTLFTLAECEAKWGHVATAVKRYDEYLALYQKLSPDKKQHQGDREQVSRAAKAALLPKVPELTLTPAPGFPPGTQVTNDGAPVPAASLGAPLQMDPGEHVIAWQPPGKPPVERRVTVAAGDKKIILLDVKAEVAPPTDAALPAPVVEEASSGPSGRRVGAFVAGGVGVAGLLVGAVTGGLALGKKSTVEGNCGSGIHSTDPSACNATGLSAASSLKTMGAVSTAGFVVGLVGVGVGIGLFVSEPKAKAASGQGARWVGVEVAGPGASLKGTW